MPEVKQEPIEVEVTENDDDRTQEYEDKLA